MLRHLSISILLLALSAPGYTEECIPIPHHTTSTHYEPITVHKIDISKGVVVRGRVLAGPDCTPLARAKVAHWQAGENGHYSDELRAHMVTDAKGRFQFETEWPTLSPPHIHFIVSTDGYDTLETQWIGDARQSEIEFTMVLEKKNRN